MGCCRKENTREDFFLAGIRMCSSLGCPTGFEPLSSSAIFHKILLLDDVRRPIPLT